MDTHIDEFYQASSEGSSHGGFHEVIFLNKERDISWPELVRKVPTIPKGWYELTHISPKDRIDFTYETWLRKLSYHPKLEERLKRFFNSLDDIVIIITQQKWDDPFEAQMVYSLSNNNGFYRGAVPAAEEDTNRLKSLFKDQIFPEDYLAFLQIHNGFCKTTDCTGILKSTHVGPFYEQFQEALAKEPGILTTKGVPVNPKSLIPFYESFGMPYYQCFWVEWYPEQEMGNVYYSGSSKTISDIKNEDPESETLAFPTFSDWLAFYLEGVD